MIFDPRPCELGEGALWHPLREQLFWFDILNNRLMSQLGGKPLSWQFDRRVSAAGWISQNELLIASETNLFRFDLTTGAETEVAPLEADNAVTRSNDGRADRQGGFWIGTMGKKAEAGAGAIYRLYKGELRQLFAGLSIPNSMCFAPDGRTAYFSDTLRGQIMRVGLNEAGWPVGKPEVFVDLRAEGLNPDGAVVDADGVVWNAQWGAGRIAAYAPDGQFLRAVAVGAPHSSCPAFGGPDLATLFVTTALEHMDEEARAAHPDAGKLFATQSGTRGLPEPQVTL